MRKILFIIAFIIVAVAVFGGRGAFKADPPSDTELPPADMSPVVLEDELGPGYYHFSLQHDGYMRDYALYVPASYKKGTSIPAVIIFHGTGGDADVTRTGTCPGNVLGDSGCMDSIADRERFLVLYPEGLFNKRWNDGRGLDEPVMRENIDDSGFAMRMLDEAEKKVAIDRSHVYATGISNGALMAFRVACEHGDRIAAIAPIAGSMGINWANGNCKPARPVSVLMMNGDKDFVAGSDFKKGNRLSVDATAKEWARINGCSFTTVTNFLPDKDPSDGTTVESVAYGSCDEGSEVISYLIKNGGHTWPGGYQYLGELLIGKTTRDINANEVMWDFFRRHSR